MNHEESEKNMLENHYLEIIGPTLENLSPRTRRAPLCKREEEREEERAEAEGSTRYCWVSGVSRSFDHMGADCKTGL